MKHLSKIDPSSFRDPSGFVFSQNGDTYRQINLRYREDYDHLMQSGLYDDLAADGLLIPHHEVGVEYAQSGGAYKVIRPELISFLSYPYEWCFSQLKDAALTTLAIEKKALDFGMSLKDCSAYNIQFRETKPIFIDTLSFERHRPDQPWVAYRQFCQQFLAPLALMKYVDVRLNQLLRIYIDGIPLDLASSLLPPRTYMHLPLVSHIHLHARFQTHFSDKQVKPSHRKMNRLALKGFVDNLESTVKRLKWQPEATEWGDYYSDTNYSEDAVSHKKSLVARFLDEVEPKVAWDLGANTGLFSRVATHRGIQTIAFDVDPAAVEKNYRSCLREQETKMLPLLLDLTNPSPSIGWENRERLSFSARGPVDVVLALALIHHLAISNNVPFSRIADLFSKVGNFLIIEFVPKSDSQVHRLLASREDIFDGYSEKVFEREFGQRFIILNSTKIRDSKRTLYLMRKK